MMKFAFTLILPFALALTALGSVAVEARQARTFRRACAEALETAGKTAAGLIQKIRAKADQFQAAFRAEYERASRAHHEDLAARLNRAGTTRDIPWLAALDRKVDYVIGLIARTFVGPRLRGIFNTRAIRSQSAHRVHRHQMLAEAEVTRMVRRTIARFPADAELWAYELPAPLALFVKGRVLPKIFSTGTVVVLNEDLVVDASVMLNLKATPVRSNARDLVPTR